MVPPAKHPDAACDGGPFKIEGVSLSVLGGVQVLWSDGGVHHTGPGLWQRHLRLLLQLLESVCRLPHRREPDGALVEVVLVSAVPPLQGMPVLVGFFSTGSCCGTMDVSCLSSLSVVVCPVGTHASIVMLSFLVVGARYVNPISWTLYGIIVTQLGDDNTVVSASSLPLTQ